MIVAGALASPRVMHGFFTRQGGVSAGIYRSLNCGLGSADRPEAVAENRRRAMEQFALPSAALCTAYQVHSADVVQVDRPWPRGGEPPRADGLVTDRPGIALGVLTADCAPVLLADAQAGVIGAAHAGWKGALAGVAEATVAAMVRAGARAADIAAAIGPCIASDSYEVGPEVRARFTAADPAHARFFRPGRADRLHFDLPGFVAARLAAAGVARIETTGQDTCADADGFFSYRRATHRGETDYGRQLSAIALRADG